jgi:hypothetical protein
MSTPKRLETFAIVFATVAPIVYVIAVEKNFALITYHPMNYSFGLGAQPPGDGPAMYWFGWMATAALAGGAAGVIASFLPATLTRFLRPVLAWVVPAGVIAAFAYLLHDYFLR